MVCHLSIVQVLFLKSLIYVQLGSSQDLYWRGAEDCSAIIGCKQASHCQVCSCLQVILWVFSSQARYTKLQYLVSMLFPNMSLCRYATYQVIKISWFYIFRFFRFILKKLLVCTWLKINVLFASGLKSMKCSNIAQNQYIISTVNI